MDLVTATRTIAITARNPRMSSVLAIRIASSFDKTDWRPLGPGIAR
jgi:hypothetical protein